MSDEWTKDRLMGVNLQKTETPETDPRLWGVPGYLTEEECEAYFQFKEALKGKDEAIIKTVFALGDEGNEVWTFTRWLRARKFVVEDVMKMLEGATECHKDPRKQDYYPDPKAALGCEAGMFYAQYPQLYTGFAKNGAPIFISKPGILDVDAVECITTLEGIIRFHWYIMMHDYAGLLRKEKEKNPDFKFECFCILDLAHLTTSQLSKRSLAIIKEQSAIDGLCFPETMSKMFLINAPVFFAATWSLIKGWLDPRTASKIEVCSGRSYGEKKLLELVDADQLPSDYGGTATPTNEQLRKQLHGGVTRLYTEMVYLRSSGSVKFDVEEGEYLEIDIYTRSLAGAKISVVDAENKSTTIVPEKEVIHNGTSDTSEPSTKEALTSERIKGPVKLKLVLVSNAGRFSPQNFLFAFSCYPNAS